MVEWISLNGNDNFMTPANCYWLADIEVSNFGTTQAHEVSKPMSNNVEAQNASKCHALMLWLNTSQCSPRWPTDPYTQFRLSSMLASYQYKLHLAFSMGWKPWLYLKGLLRPASCEYIKTLKCGKLTDECTMLVFELSTKKSVLQFLCDVFMTRDPRRWASLF